MPKGLLGKKIGMSQYFTETGDAIVVTYIEAGPCTALQVKTKDKDGYEAVQLGFGKKRKKSTNKAQLGCFDKVKAQPLQFLREVKMEPKEEIKPGQEFFVDIFKPGDMVDIVGTSIGKGFQGGVKRWHWLGGCETHGSMTHRRPGSIGASAFPSRVIKGQHLPGHMGNCKVTAKNLEIIEVDKEHNLLVIEGAVPGYKGNYLVIKQALSAKKKKQKPPVAEAAKQDKKPDASKAKAKAK
ncbi:MAG: 50S ribosomal protein L3 [Candidatus Omnitrophota bacterium]